MYVYNISIHIFISSLFFYFKINYDDDEKMSHLFFYCYCCYIYLHSKMHAFLLFTLIKKALSLFFN